MITTIFWILVSVAIILILIQLIALMRYQYESKHSPLFKVASAGSVKPYTPKEFKITNIHWNDFIGEDGEPIDATQYKQFITIGDSMLLGGIKDKDILFVKDVKDINSISFPAFMVLKREPSALKKAMTYNDRAELKIRRTWKLCSLSETDDDILKKVDDIINTSSFQTLLLHNKDCFPSPEDLQYDFIRRLSRYRKERPDCVNKDNNKAFISTTLTSGKVHFSIHSTNMLVGEVKYAFGML